MRITTITHPPGSGGPPSKRKPPSLATAPGRQRQKSPLDRALLRAELTRANPPEFDEEVFTAFLSQGSPEFWARPRPLASESDITAEFPFCCGGTEADKGSAIARWRKGGGA